MSAPTILMQLASVGFTQTASPNRIDIRLAESQHRAPFTFHYLLPRHSIASLRRTKCAAEIESELDCTKFLAVASLWPQRLGLSASGLHR